MNLGEAKAEYYTVLSKIAELEKYLVIGKTDSIPELLDNMSNLLEIKRSLCRGIKKTEDSAKVGNNTYYDLVEACDLLALKITVMELLSTREDLTSSQQESIKQQLKTYRETRDTLKFNLQKCIWSTELLVE